MHICFVIINDVASAAVHASEGVTDGGSALQGRLLG